VDNQFKLTYKFFGAQFVIYILFYCCPMYLQMTQIESEQGINTCLLVCSIVQALLVVPELIKIKDRGLASCFRELRRCADLAYLICFCIYVSLRYHNKSYRVPYSLHMQDQEFSYQTVGCISILHLLLVSDFIRKLSFYCKITDKFG
jgi:hypothetical protein